MGEFSLKNGLVRFRNAWRSLAFALALLAAFPLVSKAQPSLITPSQIGYPTTQITLGNCTNGNTVYLVQMSTNLTDWTPVTNCFARPTNFPVFVPSTNDFAFYRLITNPILSPSFQYALVSRSNVVIKGNAVAVDSFDSSDPLYSIEGIYVPFKRKANGNVATCNKLQTTIAVQYYNIYGSLITGYGTVETNVGMPPDTAIGDINWNATNTGIEPGYWTNDFLMSFPDVPAPVASASLPGPDTNGIIQLSSGAYLATTDPGKQININGPVTLWVTTSYSPNITFNTNNTNASLFLYVGATTGSAVSLTLGGNGDLNYPGYAKNLQIYGLPTLTAVSFNPYTYVTAIIYAPEATVSGGGGGATTMDTSGAIIANSISMNGHWNFHYDESLGQLAFPTFQ